MFEAQGEPTPANALHFEGRTPKWSDTLGRVRRYVPELSLPELAYIPGRSARPRASPSPPSLALDERSWRAHTLYLWGFDLWRAGFPWEAHEAWEDLWRTKDRASPEALILQALIKLAAADVKARQGREASVRAHTSRAIELLREAARVGEPIILGVDVAAWIDAIGRGDAKRLDLAGL